MDESRLELIAEATDVIGSQSRQEVAVIKHNRYAFAYPTRCTMQMRRFCTATTAEPLQLDAQLIAG
jgi:hypothetical protein